MGAPIGTQICPNACQIPSKSGSGNRLRSKRAQTLKLHIVVHFGMIFRCPSLPQSLPKQYPKSCFGDQNKPRSLSRRDLQNCMQKGIPFFQKLSKKWPRRDPQRDPKSIQNHTLEHRGPPSCSQQIPEMLRGGYTTQIGARNHQKTIPEH